MNQAQRKQAVRSAKQTARLRSTFCEVRILHYAGAKPVPSSTILERLRSHDRSIAPATLNRLLQQMARNGSLRTKRSTGGIRGVAHRTYSLTPKGRQALNLARKWLKAFVKA
jgi:DNA-binding PadR family transcriptional regulator